MRLSVTPLCHWIYRQEIAEWLICLIWLSILNSVITRDITIRFHDIILIKSLTFWFIILQFGWGLYFVYVWTANRWFHFCEMKLIFLLMNKSTSISILAVFTPVHAFLVFWESFKLLLTVCKNTIITALAKSVHIVLT